MDRTCRLGGRYALEHVLGQGGMAEVRLARDLLLNRTVAVKTLRPELAADPGHRARFHHEAVSAASLGHPSIVTVYDSGEDMTGGGVVPYIVMEYVDGTTLCQSLRDGRTPGPVRALELVSRVLEALTHAHDRGIVHRDVKPANVMLSRDGTVKVMDFGIARPLNLPGMTLTRTSMVLGTPEYLAPEQARGERVDARADLYAAGCLLYELLTGRPPFSGDSPLAVAMQHVKDLPVPPSHRVEGLSAAHDAVVLRALAKDPLDRYQTAEEMRDALARALTHRATAAPSRLPTPPAADRDDRLRPSSAPRKARAGRRRYVRRSVQTAAVLLAITLGAYLIAGPDTPRTAVAAPSLIGKTMTEARSRAQAANLRLQRTGERSCPRSVPAGRVCEQIPAPGSQVARHTTVQVTVSRG